MKKYTKYIKTSSKFIKIVISTIAFSLFTTILPTQAAEPNVPLTVGPYIQRVSDSNSTILAQTATATDITLHYKRTDKSTWKSKSSDNNTTHRFRLSNLRPGKTYEYYLEDSQQRLTTEYEFTTEKNVSNSNQLRLAVVGDSGTASANEYAVVAQMLHWKPELLLHTGDIAYNSGTTEEFIMNHFVPYQALLAEVPMYGSIGNHDYTTENAAPYETLFELPKKASGTEQYYSFNYDDIHIVSLNTNLPYTEGSEMYTWLEDDLADAQSKRWTIVFFHQPPYSSGDHGSTVDMQTTIVPLFEQYGVDVVFNGHDHNYERSAVVNGVRYIVTGGGGSTNLYEQANLDLNPYSEYFNAVYHFLGVTISNNSIKIKAIDSNGQIFDTVTVTQNK